MTDTALLAEADMREKEVADYERNISRFKAMLTRLPNGDWPGDIAQYRDAKLPVPAELDDDTEDLIASYRNRDMLAARIRSEKGQMRIAALALDVIRADIGDGYADALAAYRASVVVTTGEGNL